VVEETKDLWSQERDHFGNVVDVSMQMREALGFWK
jgi:hypothetical protein